MMSTFLSSLDATHIQISEDVWDEDSAYLEMLAKEVDIFFPSKDPHIQYCQQGARLREKSEKQADGEDIEDSDDEDSDVEEELGYISPLDKVNPYTSFKEALTSMSRCIHLRLNLMRGYQRFKCKTAQVIRLPLLL